MVSDFWMTSQPSRTYISVTKAYLYKARVYYKQNSENVAGFFLTNFCLDCAEENTSSMVQETCRNFGIKLEFTPPYAPQSNGLAEGYIQELGMRAGVLLFGLQLLDKL